MAPSDVQAVLRELASDDAFQTIAAPLDELAAWGRQIVTELRVHAYTVYTVARLREPNEYDHALYQGLSYLHRPLGEG